MKAPSPNQWTAGEFPIFSNYLDATETSTCQAFPYCPAVSGKVEGRGPVSSLQPRHSEFCPLTTLSSPFLEPDDIRIQTNSCRVQGGIAPIAAIRVPCVSRGHPGIFSYLCSTEGASR